MHKFNCTLRKQSINILEIKMEEMTYAQKIDLSVRVSIQNFELITETNQIILSSITLK